MLCLGSVYAWSIIGSELIETYSISALQSQLIFGSIIALFPTTMIFVGQLWKRLKYSYLGYISGILFLLGYYISSLSNGNFILLFLGIGVLTGIATGFGYWVAITAPIQWFPAKKGLITGIAAGGFGLGAIFMSEICEIMLNRGFEILELLQLLGIIYGLILIVSSHFLYQNKDFKGNKKGYIKLVSFIKEKKFKKLFIGIFLGTFAGLLIIGGLKTIGGEFGIREHILILGVVFFASTNFLGRLIWGFLSDYIGASLSIFIALLLQSISILLLNVVFLNEISFIALAMFIGFGFGGNFVLFVKETAHSYGIRDLGTVYPYVFMGYALAGIIGPISGGALFDYSGSYFYAILIASLLSFMGSLIFLIQYFNQKKIK